VRALTLAMDYRSEALAVWAQGGSIYARLVAQRGAPGPLQRLAPADTHTRMDRDYELQTHRARIATGGIADGARVLERVIAELRLPARARILDAGCGSGRNMVELARHGTVTGSSCPPRASRSRASAVPAR
jgi:SAM-dependent methyltransferase